MHFHWLDRNTVKRSIHRYVRKRRINTFFSDFAHTGAFKLQSFYNVFASEQVSHHQWTWPFKNIFYNDMYINMPALSIYLYLFVIKTVVKNHSKSSLPPHCLNGQAPFLSLPPPFKLNQIHSMQKHSIPLNSIKFYSIQYNNI